MLLQKESFTLKARFMGSKTNFNLATVEIKRLQFSVSAREKYAELNQKKTFLL